MKAKIKDMTGQRIGMLRVVGFSGISEGAAGMAKWLCKCDCGGEIVAFGSALRRKNPTDSCGCLKAQRVAEARTTHGMTDTPTFLSWRSMKARCNNPNDPEYHNYGGRGITFCERWNDFEAFLADMGERPEGTTLDREKNERGYEPGNCRWATAIEQSSNKRTSKYVEVGGEKITYAEFARRLGIGRQRLRHMIVSGRSVEEITAVVTKEGGMSTIKGALS